MDKQQYILQVFEWFGLDVDEAIRVDTSMEAQREQLYKALNSWPGRPRENLSICYTFSDRLIAIAFDEQEDGRSYGSTTWEIPWSMVNDEVVFGVPVEVKMATIYEPVGEAVGTKRRLQEVTDSLALVEGTVTEGRRQVKAIGITADVVNKNGRRYPRAVLAEAVKQLNQHLHESSGQGKLIATGEVEHPNDKSGQPSILETVVAWKSASLDAVGRVILEGHILPTQKGKDVQILLESGVPIGVSMRGRGSVKTVKEDGEVIDEVTKLVIGAFDLVAQPSDPNGAIIEAEQHENREAHSSVKESIDMDEELKKQLEDAQRQLQVMEGQLTEANKAQAELAHRKAQEAVDQAITAATKDLKYPAEMNALFVESLRDAKPETPEQVKTLVENKRKEYDALASAAKLASMGRGFGDVDVLGPVFERDTGQPEYTRAAFELNESLIKSGEGRRLTGDWADTPGGIFTKRVLERFDKVHSAQLAAETRMFNEAITTADLNLPYSVARMIIEQAYPGLIAASVYDFGVTDQAPARIYYETYAGDVGSYATITTESVVASTTDFVSMAHKRVRPGTVTVTHTSGSPTYTEGTDYVLDYGNGGILAIATIVNGATIKVTYDYDAYREGEGVAIERAESTLAFMTMNIMADRLAMEVTTEAIVFSRSQLNYDAVNRTLANLVKLVRRKIDKDILYSGLTAALRVANNSGGTWTSSTDDIVHLVEDIGIAKVKVYNRFYTPTSIVMSQTNADRLSNWDGFKVMGFDNARINSAGFAGSVKGLPVFASPEYPDGYVQVVNRELVIHRVYSPMRFKGPFPSFSNGKLVAAEQYYIEEFNGTAVPVIEKTAYVKVA